MFSGQHTYFQHTENLASPFPNNQREQQQNHQDLNFANEQSFLSDFNIQDELFGGQPLFPMSMMNDDSILPFKRPESSYRQTKQANIQEHHHIAHENNQVLNKLVGTKRRKVGEIEHQQVNVDTFLCMNESINSSTHSSHETRNKQQNIAGVNAGTGGEMTSYSSSMRAETDEVYESIDDYKKAKKRVQNRESAIRSRMKKKQYYETVEGQYIQLQQETNKLKLDNAALRAENQLLKRYLNYFENLFAKKTQSTAQSYTNSNISSKPTSRCGGQSDDEIYNSRQTPIHVKKRQGGSLNVEDIVSQSGDNEASRGMKDKLQDVSFILERKTTDSSGSSPGKMGLFSIALVMCVCCFSSFFSPLGTDLTGGDSSVKVPKVVSGISGQSLKFIDAEGNQIEEVDATVQTQANIYTTTLICWGNFLKLIFLVFFAVTILTFPLDDIKQWAARKSWLRKIFNLNDIPIQASKNIKSL